MLTTCAAPTNPQVFSVSHDAPCGLRGGYSEGAHACSTLMRQSYHPARSPARRNAAHRAMAKQGFGWGSSTLARGTTAHRIHRPQTLLHPHTTLHARRRVCATRPQPKEVAGARPTQPASATYRACAQRHTSTSSVVCRACRTSITVQRCWTEKASCGLLCTLRGTTGGLGGAGWRRVCAVPNGPHS